VWADVEMVDVYAKAQKMCALFTELAEGRCGKHGITLYGHRDWATRGSHVCLAHEQAYAVMQALISRSVIGDFRAPDMMRFGFAPLYNSFADVWDAVEHLALVLDGKLWDVPEFREKKAVT
jgi:kynureninase